MLFTNACRTYDTTSSLRPVTQLRYDLFTNMVANGNRIVCTIRLFAGRISTIVYISMSPAFDEDVINIRTLFVNMEKFKVTFVYIVVMYT